MRVLIGGATGFIGRHLGQALKNAGHDVIALSRSGGYGRITWTDLQRDGFPKDCDAVVNLAGENIMNPMKRWDDDFKSLLYASRIDSTRQIAEVIQRSEQKPKVFISSSAVGYYAPSQTAEYTEDSPSGGEDFFTKLCTAWEQAAVLPPDAGVRQAVIRIGLALGRDGGAIQQMFWPFWLGVGGPIGDGRQWFPWIHVDDVAGMIHHAIENDHVSGVLNATAPQSVTNAEFTKTFASALWRPAFIPMPGFAANLVFSPERAALLTEGQKVIPKRTLESGYEFIYPDLKSACKEFSHAILRNVIPVQ